MTNAMVTNRLRPFQRFFQTESAGGVVLLLSACMALLAANSPWADLYDSVWAFPILVGGLDHSLTLPLQQWVNDGLMAIFFLLVGLEIKRELVAGELSSPRQASLPFAAAIGGMIVPALLYTAMNYEGVRLRGWGIPMATDIAFALGALSLIAPRCSTGLKVFLAALAIVDDMGAVAVIALFYTQSLAYVPLVMACVTFAALVVLNLAGVTRLAPYLLTGLALWLFVHESGLHATIAGVLLASTIPTRTQINAKQFAAEARTLVDEFDRTETGDYVVLTSKGQQEAIDGLERAAVAVTAPLLRLEHALHGLSAFVVMPLFALANAGVRLESAGTGAGVAVGVALGLLIGKPIGITAAAFIAVKAGLASLPVGVNWAMLHGSAWLGGIGFTMSLFIATLAFEDAPLLAAAKVGIIGGSVIAALVATTILRFTRTDAMECPS